jgi:hypothetical protein
MKTLRLRSCGFKSYDSAEKCIHAAEAVNRASAAPAITESLRGKQCVKVGCSDSEAVFVFEEGYRLRIRVAPDLPDLLYTLDREETDEPLPVATDVMIQFADASEEPKRTCFWPRSRLIECVGLRLAHVYWNGDSFYVAWRGRQEQVSFHPVEDIVSGTVMLYWWDGD